MLYDHYSREQLLDKINTLTNDVNLLKENDLKRVMTEKALIKSKATAYALLNATSDLAALLNPRGIILEINEAAMRRVNKGVADLTGKSVFDFFPPEFRQIHSVYINIVTQTKEPLHFQDEYEGMIFQVCIYPILDNEEEVERLAVFVNDNTEHRRMQELLFRYSQILSTVHDPMAFIDKNLVFRTVNDAFMTFYQKKREEIEGHPVEALLGQDFIEKKIKWNIQKCLAGEKVNQQEWFDFPDGKRRCMYMIYYPLFAKDDVVSGVIFNATNITKIKEMEEELKRLSVTDQLTQVFNRVQFSRSLEEEIKRHKRYETDLSLIMFDIDHFKSINDTYGHDVGDTVLVGLAKLIQRCIRDTDIFSRWGGEEFMLLLPHTHIDNATKLAERIRTRIMANEFEVIGSLTCSFGVTQFRSEDTDETFTKRVDNALYESKHSGRNRVTVM